MDTAGRDSRRCGGPGGGGGRDQISYYVHDVRDWVFDEDEDGRLYLTSSGVAAGGDAALALIARLAGDAEAEQIATAAEWTWHRDADAHPFATE